ncbi:MAG: ABC transporter permease [Comamonadaceae bacterium CG2_30_57_122]|nr:MAG: ABC transporter permease [Comamonadaceae bacterium CG2_30_57_122]
MPEATPTLTLHTRPTGRCAVLGGCWSAARLADPGQWSKISQTLVLAGSSRGVQWDLLALTRLDHTGAQLLWNTWGRQWPMQLQVNPAQQAMLQRVARFSGAELRLAPMSIGQRFLKLGEQLWLLWDHLLGLLALTGQLLLDLLTLVRSPRCGPWRDMSGHLYRIGATALPVTALVGFMIGIVLAYLMSRQLRQFGADTFIVNILGIGLIRELGPMLAAILIAGRSGSAITAQIGVMRVTEELDAMRVMGIAQGYRLVLPRALACAVAMPLISVWTTLAALLGGMLAADAVLGVTPAYFFATLPRAVEIGNLWLALGKSMVFGVLIALVGCHYGLRVKPNTESLGQGTTASVVTSITVVLLVDALFAVVFKNVGI